MKNAILWVFRVSFICCLVAICSELVLDAVNKPVPIWLIVFCVFASVVVFFISIYYLMYKPFKKWAEKIEKLTNTK